MSAASDLTEASWQVFSRLLDEALEQPPGERLTWLDSLGPEHAPVKPALRAVLEKSARVETRQWLGTLPRDGTPPPADESDLQPGALVGPYRLIRELGLGGMGAVWLAERADGKLKRQVALKLPRASWTRGLAERMGRERDILASLEHPNIARLYDAGTDAQGRPYLALEYVEGETIDTYASARNLPVRARVELLLQVARAVAYAHGRLVVHRDLKPSNIFVTADGQVRLLDFGIAKLLEGDRAAETQLTQLAGRALTPDYASPEQIRGEPIGTASDVYSLGVVAFELLTGQRPYRLKRGSAAEVEEAVIAADVPLASSVAGGPGAKRALRGDLDAILAQSLRKDAERRYASVVALADDLERHLQGQPVAARPDSRAYRLRKFAARNRLAVAFVATIIVLLSASTAIAVWQAKSVAAERDRALRLAERNRAANAFMSTLLTRTARGGSFTALQLVERGEGLLASETADVPDHRAYVLGLIAGFFGELDQTTRALSAYDKALAAAEQGSDHELRVYLAGRRALALGMLGRSDEAISELDRLLRIPDVPAEGRSNLHKDRAVLAQAAGDFPAAMQHASEALRWYRAAERPDPRQEPVLLGEVGWAELKNGNAEAAEAHFAQMAHRFEDLGLSDSGTALQYGQIRALMMQERGDLRRATALYDELMKASRRAMPDVPPSVYLQANRAYALTHRGQFEQAEAAYRDSAALAKSQGMDLVRYNIRMLLVELFALRQQAGLARQELEQAQGESKFEGPDGGPAVFARQQAEAQLALAEGQPALAIRHFTEGLADRTVSAGTINVLLGRAAAYDIAGRLDEAGNDAADALALAEKLRGSLPTSFRSGLASLTLARIREQQGRSDEAKRLESDAWRHLKDQLDPAHPAYAEAARRVNHSLR